MYKCHFRYLNFRYQVQYIELDIYNRLFIYNITAQKFVQYQKNKIQNIEHNYSESIFFDSLTLV